jgi:hypothetical protein
VVLVNGRRISGFAEIRNLPPEAILRTECCRRRWRCNMASGLDQRVVTSWLSPRFRAITAEL